MAKPKAIFVRSISTSNLSAKYRQPNFFPYAVIVVTLAVVVVLLLFQGRQWWCACGEFYLWAGDIWSRHNSQHFIDPYSFTHISHGLFFYWILTLAMPRITIQWRLCISIAIESLWELIENTDYVINRYREATISLEYYGDSIVNSLGDIIFCGGGFLLAYFIGLRWSVVLFVLMEVILIFWIRDSLLINIIMLIYPIDSIRTWQMGI